MENLVCYRIPGNAKHDYVCKQLPKIPQLLTEGSLPRQMKQVFPKTTNIYNKGKKLILLILTKERGGEREVKSSQEKRHQIKGMKQPLVGKLSYSVL